MPVIPAAMTQPKEERERFKEKKQAIMGGEGRGGLENRDFFIRELKTFYNFFFFFDQVKHQ